MAFVTNFILFPAVQKFDNRLRFYVERNLLQGSYPGGYQSFVSLQTSYVIIAKHDVSLK